jgi:peroxiredoxin
VGLTHELERLRHNCASNLLQAMLDQNPSKEVKGHACLALAGIRKDAAAYGKNKLATAEAEKLYQRVISEFSEIKERGYSLAELAAPELAELRNLTIGKVAPEIAGEDLSDAPLKLSEFHGSVVVLFFWSAASLGESEAYQFRNLVDQMQGKRFVMLGIHADDNDARAKAVAEQYALNWRSFKDARGGPISKTYNINSWNTIYVLDKQGVIRNRGLHFASEVASLVNELLHE